MAGIARHAELAFVAIVVVFAMAFNAHQRQFFFEAIFVTGSARRRFMLVEQWKFAIAIVIEIGFRPAAFLVATIAFFAQGAFVNIIFRVAGYATGG